MLDLELSLLDVRGDSVIPAAAYLAVTEDKTRVAIVRKSSGMVLLISYARKQVISEPIERTIQKNTVWNSFE